MLPHYLHSYPEKQPNPWPADKEVPNSATEEVLEYWRAKSEPRIRHPCRKLVFTLKSHDQGWGGDINTEEDKYAGSFTWFDIGLEKMSATKESRTSFLSCTGHMLIYLSNGSGVLGASSISSV